MLSEAKIQREIGNDHVFHAKVSYNHGTQRFTARPVLPHILPWFWLALWLIMLTVLVISAVNNSVYGLVLSAFGLAAPMTAGAYAKPEKPRHQPTELDRLFEAAVQLYLLSPNMEVSELDELLEELGHDRVPEKQIRAILRGPRRPYPDETARISA